MGEMGEILDIYSAKFKSEISEMMRCVVTA